jgi:hypothetical protein
MLEAVEIDTVSAAVAMLKILKPPLIAGIVSNTLAAPAPGEQATTCALNVLFSASAS